MKHLLFVPIYQERVWGGTNLAHQLGRELPDDKVIGESWDIVDRPEAQSQASDGTSLRELIQRSPEAIMGAGWSAERRFPILVKWLDCQQKLSLQVHPPAEIAQQLGGEPKTENWYIADAAPHATLIAGLKQGATRADFEAALQDNELEAWVHSMPAHAGESIFIPSGRLHAIGGGNLILEIQQNSDTTYRVYDWGRVGLDGKARQLHVQESLQSTDFNDFEPAMLQPNGQPEQQLVQSDAFDLRRLNLPTGQTLHFDAGAPRILSVVSGSMTEADGSPLQRGDNALLPAAEAFDYTATSDCVLLITEDFARVN